VNLSYPVAPWLFSIIISHRSITYVDAAYCYRPSSFGVGVLVVSPAKTAEPIEMPFALSTRMGPKNRVLDGGPDPTWKWAILRDKGAAHCEV